ncbi:rhodanese family protein [Sandarakinorhabdus rubra]|uniref:rhodanese family protein n=1 Tax=Sandarakinorhabdus rubra TaxID=2672568 RepID=UPI0013DB3BB5|nr:rhodanese family protein [Sandarakinorhabdus rubra]
MINTISPTDAAALVADGRAMIVDVREPAEFAARHIPASLSRPLSVPDTGPLACGDGMTLVFTCQSGRRTAANADRLAALGPQGRVHLLAGGVDAWGKSGLGLAGREAEQRLPIMRQVQIAAGLLVLTGVLLTVMVAPAWIALSAFVGAGLTFAGATGWCGMAQLLARMPWNSGAA